MILDFDEVIEFDKLGNKARFLIEMKKAGYNVPAGFVIDCNIYKEVIKDNAIDIKLEKIIKKLNQNNAKETSEKILKLFDKLEITNKIIEKINNKISNNKKYAVRSSGIKEDLDNYSFAGQYETFLNVESKDVIKRVIDCYKSMFSETILNYLLNNDIAFENLEMTVIVQEMVDSEISGVCFTINPITGNDKEMLIEVGVGLGENVVSGKVAPEQYCFDWYNSELKYDEKNKLLNEKLLRKMTKVFTEIQLFFGYPCDIEFAIFDNEIYILQARKITKIKYQGIKDVWSTADFKDGGVSATICTPYMWSLYEYIWEYTLKKFIIDSKILKESEIDKKLGNMFYSRCYWNMSIVKKAMSKVVGYKEREFDSEYGIKMNYEGDGQITKITLQSLIHIARIAIAQNKILKTRNQNANKYKNDLLKKYDLYKKNYDNKNINDIKKVWYNLTYKDYLESESTYFWQIFINTVHQALYKDSLLKYVSESEYLTLLSSIEDISHLLPFYDIWDLSREIRKNSKELDYWISTPNSQILADIKNSKENEFIEFKEIINNYGYHSEKELDVTYECYFENITPLIITLRDMISLEDSFSPIEDREKGKKQYEDILRKIQEKVNCKKYIKIKNKIEKMRKMLWWREEFRDISTRFYYIIRIYTIELAKQLVKEKVINEIDDIWFLSVTNLWEHIDGKISKEKIREFIAKNKLYYYSYKNYMSENEIGSIFTDLNSDNTDLRDDEIKGLGANNGVVIGTARVIESFDEIDKLRKDDILVTKFTDTGWTSKFAILSGIVTEYGGILCHAAIVSREYGIPAIVSCYNVMKKIKDGQKIKIDGTTGVVTILED